ncbi:MAG: DUF4278 domain-containing protein [Oscillatoriales cyanobacterium C42_A2020_001]|nr:DUF4278 domain-containing protein [Leptolyngbyaceae cyanobacterium C42_A2020_001]
MSLFHLALQVMAVCVFVAVLMFGLLSAPWYILFGLLLLTLVLTWLLMPGREAWVTHFVSLNPLPLPDEPLGQAANQEIGEVSRANLTYRGACYGSQVDAVSDDSAVLTYRGAHYSKGTQAPETQVHQDSEVNCTAPSTMPTPELKYRGARVNQ